MELYVGQRYVVDSKVGYPLPLIFPTDVMATFFTGTFRGKTTNGDMVFSLIGTKKLMILIVRDREDVNVYESHCQD